MLSIIYVHFKRREAACLHKLKLIRQKSVVIRSKNRQSSQVPQMNNSQRRPQVLGKNMNLLKLKFKLKNQRGVADETSEPYYFSSESVERLLLL